MISYKPLWRLLLEKDIKKLEFAEMVNISTATLAKLSKNENVSLDVICKICEIFDCKIEEVIEYVKK